MQVDDEWNNYLCNINNPGDNIELFKNNLNNTQKILITDQPVCDDLYISTKTKVLFLNQCIDIHNVFWKLPILKYSERDIGIVKKQIKIISKSSEEYDSYSLKLKGLEYYTENIIKSINNPDARRIIFKDERKLTVGISKKDIMNCRGKVKNAFYNCFAIVIRFMYNNEFREIHIKVFNTGKLEIPGILNSEIFDIVSKLLIKLIQPYISTKLEYKNIDTESNVLINSNFNCGYYINREVLYTLLRNQYGIEAAYEPCSYPGVKCKYYFNNIIGFDNELQNGQIDKTDRCMKMKELNVNKKYTEVSFMIFRTGSCLIVGNCTERILRFVYTHIKQLLRDEYINICVDADIQNVTEKKIKLRKKTIYMTTKYYNNWILKNI
jgi:hypothetical protein